MYSDGVVSAGGGIGGVGGHGSLVEGRTWQASAPVVP